MRLWRRGPFGGAVGSLRLALLLLLAPLLVGLVVVTYQDAVRTHWPARATTRAQLRAGEFPFLHPGSSCGQPLAGNPNFGVFFPDTLLLPLLSLPIAFGLRFALPLLLGYLGARRWARAEGAGRGAAELAAISFVLSGVFLSAWRFYNTGLALAVGPWVMAGLAKLLRRSVLDDRPALHRATAELGIAAALEVLAGEPVVALLVAALGVFRVATEPPPPRRVAGRAILSLGTALVLALLLAAPQLAATAQILPESSREKRPFAFAVATATSTPAERLVEQVVPFPWGRPDLRGPSGMSARYAPYVWTLHISLPVLGLLLLCARLGDRRDLRWIVVCSGGALLAFGRYLPLAGVLYPVLSLGGRIRFPVKWWYAVALALVPLVASCADRWLGGERPGRARLVLLALGGLAAVIVGVRHWPSTLVAAVGPFLEVLVLATLVVMSSTRWARHAIGAAAVLAVSLLACGLPLLLALLDRPPNDPPHVTMRRIVSRTSPVAHPEGLVPQGEESVRLFHRRASAELWPLIATVTGAGYAFDFDPDGAYSDDDRAMRKLVDALPWEDRATELRLAGVTHVVVDRLLPPPYREERQLRLNEVWLYGLEGAAPSLRLATRIVSVRTLAEVVAHHRSSAFDAETDAVVVGGTSTVGEPVAATPERLAEGVGFVRARVSSPQEGLLVWSRTYFRAWRASVDGAAVEPVLADGHLVGVPVPAGQHVVELHWSKGPVLLGGALAGLGLLLAAALALVRGGGGL